MLLSSSPYALVPLFALILATILTSAPVVALNTFTLDIPPHQEQCFYEHLNAKERLDLSYDVAEGGDLDVDFVIYTPTSEKLYAAYKESHATFGFNARQEGIYVYCFSNKISTMTTKKVSFTVHGPDEEWRISEKELNNEIEDHTEHMRTEMRQLDQGIRAIRDDHQFMVEREKVHRLTADSTNRRVVWWSLIQTIFLFGVCGFQIAYLKRFFEARRGI